MASIGGVEDGTVVALDLDGFSGQVRDPFLELVVTRRDKAAPLAVKGMADGKSGVASVAVMREVWGI